jgi:hypothetical protein
MHSQRYRDLNGSTLVKSSGARLFVGWRSTCVAALVLAGGVAAAGPAQADTLFIEAEGGGNSGHPLSNRDAKITTPFQIKDDSTASMGRYLTVAPGFNSQTAPPASEGVATYRFTVETAGSYRIWARVIAPTVDDDSFWVRMRVRGSSTSTLVRWNPIAPGTAWHWAQVSADGATTPSQFTLATSTEYELQVSYREDGAKLDVLVITSDTTFNPKTPPTTAPPLPPQTFDAPRVLPRKLIAGAKTGIRVYWSEVPGAKTYTLERSTSNGTDQTTLPTLTLGQTTHMFQETTLPTGDGSNCYNVTAVFPDGSFRQLPDNAICQELSYRQTFLDTSGTLSGSAPMVSDDATNAAYSAAGTPSSLTAPPAHGRLRLDFALGGASKLQLWFAVNLTDKAHDSFWVRMDEGTWINWNDIPNGCSVVTNDAANDARVTFSLAAGTHRFELATRETGLVSGQPLPQPNLSNILFITDDITNDGGLCND